MAEFCEIVDARAAEDSPALTLERQLLACEARHGISICVHDHSGFFRDADGEPLLLDRNVHRHPLCRFARDTTIKHCSHHCVDLVHAQSHQARAPFLGNCWKGLQEIIIPLRDDDTLLATIYAGTWPSRIVAGPQQPLPRATAYRALCAQISPPDDVDIWDLSHHLAIWASGLIRLVVDLQSHDLETDRARFIRRFLFKHAHEQVRLTDLAAALHLSPSRCSHVVQESCGASFQELLASERLQRARVLLASSPHSLAAIAERCGFSDVYYFSRFCKERLGMPPGAFRRQYRPA